MFDLNSHVGFGFTTRHIRPVDDGPFRGSQLPTGKVQRGDIISVMLEPAFSTPKESLCSPVFSDVSTSWASFRCVPWVYMNYEKSLFKGLVLDKVLKFIEGPTVEILTFPMFGSVTDSLQPLHNHYISIFKAVHKLSTYLMQRCVDPSSLLSTQPFQNSLGASCAFGLEGSAEFPEMLPLSKDWVAFNLESIRGNKQIVHSNINANRVASSRLWNFLIYSDMEEKLLVAVDENGMGWTGFLKKISLVFSNIKLGLNSLLNRDDRGVNSIGFVDEPKKSCVQAHRKLSELKKLFSSLLVRFGDPIPRSDGEVGWKIKFLPSISVGDVVKGNWIKNFAFKGYLRNVVASISKSLNSSKQLLSIFIGKLEFTHNSLSRLHQKAYMPFSYLKVAPILPLGLKTGVSLEGFYDTFPSPSWMKTIRFPTLTPSSSGMGAEPVSTSPG